jgi:osomolarity two-component system sensor histidine kinase TcsA
LCICKQIVESFEGTINFLTKENKGTTFFYTFKTQRVDAGLPIIREVKIRKSNKA